MVYSWLSAAEGADDPSLSIPMTTTFLLSDWGRPIESAVRSVAAVAVAVYVAGYVVGAWVHQLNDGLAAAVTGKPAPAPASKILQRCAAQPVVACAGLLPQEPMDQAVPAVRHGMRRVYVSLDTFGMRLAE